MTSIMSAAGECFVGDRDKGKAIYNLLNTEHYWCMKADEQILKNHEENAVM